MDLLPTSPVFSHFERHVDRMDERTCHQQKHDSIRIEETTTKLLCRQFVQPEVEERNQTRAQRTDTQECYEMLRWEHECDESAVRGIEGSSNQCVQSLI